MKAKAEEKSNSFRAPLLELVIIIGFFAIVSVYLLRMFMAADSLQGRAVATTKALVRAESLAESIKARDDFTPEVFYYTKGWEESSKESAYTLSSELVSENDEYMEICVKVTNTAGTEEYCKLKVVKAKK